MEYIEELTLIKNENVQDSIGNITHVQTERQVLARKNVVGTREFYNASAVGISLTAELQIRSSEYNGEQEAEYLGNRYSIIRTIPKGKFDLVLVLGTKQGVNNE